MSATLDAARLAEIEDIQLSRDAHDDIAQGMCVMEAAAWLAGEDHTDAPKCVSHVIAAFCRSWNDALNDKDRNRLLKPLIPRLVNTRGDKALEKRRSLMAADWLVRANTPAWLRLAGLTTHAEALASLPEITSLAQVPSIRGPIDAARVDAKAARLAVPPAVLPAEVPAEVSAAAAAAAAATAVGATRSTAEALALFAAVAAAASVAAEAAASLAARSNLAPTVATLQASALDLLERMIAAGGECAR